MPSEIEWTDETLNHVLGCSVVSPGCTNCYAMKTAGTRLANSPAYKGLTTPSKAGPVWNGKIRILPERLQKPLHRRKPTNYFVNSMGDLFHESIPDEAIDQLFAVAALCPQHTFQILTKRSKRMRAYLNSLILRQFNIAKQMGALSADWPLPDIVGRGHWPLPNVWLGVSTEDQTRADERIPDLLATPAAIRFVSAEPLLGKIDFLVTDTQGHDISSLSGIAVDPTNPEGSDEFYRTAKLDWIIAGGESGGNARPMHPDWVRSIRDQCAAADVPFFFKQWGEWAVVDGPQCKITTKRSGRGTTRMFADGKIDSRASPYHAYVFDRVGKKAAGRMLDGKTFDQFPERKVTNVT